MAEEKRTKTETTTIYSLSACCRQFFSVINSRFCCETRWYSLLYYIERISGVEVKSAFKLREIDENNSPKKIQDEMDRRRYTREKSGQRKTHTNPLKEVESEGGAKARDTQKECISANKTRTHTLYRIKQSILFVVSLFFSFNVHVCVYLHTFQC